MADKTRKVIGIDPASGDKGSYVFAPDLKLDGPMSPSKLRSLLPSRNAQGVFERKPFDTESCLVCWDAPLTGLQDPDALAEEEPSTGDGKKKDTESLTTRLIERTGKESQYPRIANASEAAGVSVRGFSGLSHWVISRNVLGLPRVGRFDAGYEELPLQPVFEKNRLEESKYTWAVTEVHPTLAVYLWLTEGLLKGESNWHQYKGQGKDSDVAKAVREMWETLCGHFSKHFSERFELCKYFDKSPNDPLSPPNGEDAFDARVAWLLGFLWLKGDEVELVGSESHGSFLLPRGAADSG